MNIYRHSQDDETNPMVQMWYYEYNNTYVLLYVGTTRIYIIFFCFVIELKSPCARQKSVLRDVAVVAVFIQIERLTKIFTWNQLREYVYMRIHVYVYVCIHFFFSLALHSILIYIAGLIKHQCHLGNVQYHSTGNK